MVMEQLQKTIQTEQIGTFDNENSTLNLIGFIGPIQQEGNVLNVMNCVSLVNDNVKEYTNEQVQCTSSAPIEKSVQKSQELAARLTALRLLQIEPTGKSKKYVSTAAMLISQRVDSVDFILGPSSKEAITTKDPKISSKSDFGKLNYEGMSYDEESD